MTSLRKYSCRFTCCSLLFSLLFLFSSSSAQTNYSYSSKKNLNGLSAAVVAAHPLAADAGTLMFSYGGNAFDAAVATQLALAVVYPRAGNLGGGGFLVALMKDDVAFTIDFRETAPSNVHANTYVDTLTGQADTGRSLNGPSSSGVPGTVAGLMETNRYARLPFDSLIAPAIRLAEQGFCITALEAEKLNSNRAVFLKNNKEKILFVKDVNWKEGDTLRQPVLANTLRRIGKKGLNDFYRGETAKYIVEEMQRGGGYVTEKDLENYRVKNGDAMRFDYKEYSLITMPLPSSGGIIMQQVLTMMQILEKKYGKPANLVQFYQRFIESERRAYADRSQWPGDPAFVDVPVDTLISKKYLTARIADFNPNKAGSSKITEPGVIESEETTHISVVDTFGNVLSITTTLNGNYGSKTMVKGAGFFLNNEMDDFSIQPGVANQFGAVGGTANAIEPGKRMLSSMSPTIVLKNGKFFAVLGAPGGTTIPSSVMLTFLRIADLKQDPSTSVNDPRLHHQWLPDIVSVEKGFPSDIASSLESKGYVVNYRSPFGTIELIVADQDGKLNGIADSRGDDSVAGEK
ncbi:MAG: gamma-glutamyltransferase [Bacteroidetes bacterium]|nr:gamma-glutamyltransferase [Bacteroidota bacterium]